MPPKPPPGTLAAPPWADGIPALTYRSTLREWWGLPSWASQEVYRGALRAMWEAEAGILPEEALRILGQEVTQWHRLHGVCALCGKQVQDLEGHMRGTKETA